MPFFDLFWAILYYHKKYIFYQIENLIFYKNIKYLLIFFLFQKGAFEFMVFLTKIYIYIFVKKSHKLKNRFFGIKKNFILKYNF